jgi:alkylation response protein AidB-like acyl-CoA dehydrogenase
MDFDFTHEQAMLRDLAREFFSRESTPRIVRAQMEDPTGFSEETWQRMAEMGLQGLSVAPEYGGQGLGMIEQALVLEEIGRAAYAGPYFASSLLGAGVIDATRDPDQMRRWLPDLASGAKKATLALLEDALAWQPSAVKLGATRSGSDYVLSGTKRFVPWAHVADQILVVARTSEGNGGDGTTVFIIDSSSSGLRLEPNVEMDHTNKTSTLHLTDIRVPADAVVGKVDKGWEIVGPVLQRAAIGAAAEMLGAARRCMEMSVEYAKMRQQFGQPIGMFQAIKHACAEMLLEVENAHAATYYAAWAHDANSPDAALAASAAKAYVSEASRKVCGSSIQVHGGIGFTWEYDLHLYVKRAKHLEPLYGDADFHREQALRLVLQPAQQAREPMLVS